MQNLVPECVDRIRRLFGADLPSCALVLGSGFDAVLGALRVRQTLAYEQLPGFPGTGVAGHEGKLVLGELSGLPMLVCSGRAHYYEGMAMEKVMFPTCVLAAAGVRKVILTNAAGGINPRFKPGDFMLIADHINFTGVNPLRGPPVSAGECFVDLTDAYSADLREKFRTAARKEKTTLREGIYLGVSGPSYETPAEIRAFRRLGADAVGMSTIPEVLMARHCGVEVAALSCITNCAAGMSKERLAHEEVLAVGRENGRKAALLLASFAMELRRSDFAPARKPIEKNRE